ncbi:hypothetical protein ACIP97_10210 [Peribacillus frigoritolerans]|uniref:hypothetical protein n=1 Tax=Peribacillus frigoritolerans TaxID=450367 RepID=UPI003805A1F8
MERKVRDSCGNSELKGDPTGASAPRRLPDRPRKASALRSNLTNSIFIKFVYSLNRLFTKAVSLWSNINIRI